MDKENNILNCLKKNQNRVKNWEEVYYETN